MKVKSIIILISYMLINISVASDFFYKEYRSNQAKSLVFVLNGLNLDSVKMLEIAKAFHSKNYHVLVGDFMQSRKNELMLNAWKKYITEVYVELKKIMNKYNYDKILFIGYSLGAALILWGLLNKDIQNLFTHKSFIFFAPAFVPSSLLKKLSPLIKLFSRISVPSMNIIEYRKYSSMPIGVYNDVLSLQKEIYHKELFSLLRKNDGIIIFDTKDEMINIEKTMINIPQHWKKIRINTVLKPKKIPHHLIIDEKSVGKLNWKNIKETITTQ